MKDSDVERANAIEEAILTGQSFVMISCESKQDEKIKLVYTHLNKESVIINPTTSR